tara:strand:- start:31 stop:303 length:273 start_codon:yes stop_codon:yes gene_type:complete
MATLRDEDFCQEVSMYIKTNDNHMVKATIREDEALMHYNRRGVWSWTFMPDSDVRVCASRDWREDEAPEFLDQCAIVLAELKRKIDEHSA